MSSTSRVYTFFSAHERLFLPVHRLFRERYRIDAFAGTVWGHDQASFLAEGDVDYDPLVVFTRDILEPSHGAAPKLAAIPEHGLSAEERGTAVMERENGERITDALVWGAGLRRIDQ